MNYEHSFYFLRILIAICILRKKNIALSSVLRSWQQTYFNCGWDSSTASPILLNCSLFSGANCEFRVTEKSSENIVHSPFKLWTSTHIVHQEWHSGEWFRYLSLQLSDGTADKKAFPYRTAHLTFSWTVILQLSWKGLLLGQNLSVEDLSLIWVDIIGITMPEIKA